MSNKRPNQNKRDKKPGLSSSTSKNQSNAKAKAATDTQSPQSTEKSAVKGATNEKSRSQKSVDKAASTTTEQKPAGSPRLSSTASGGGQSSSNQGSATGSTNGGGSSNGWIAPVALLFGLLGTGFSAYLYTQLNALRETSTTQLQSLASENKSSVATVQTNLDEKATTLTASIDEKAASLSSALEEKTSALANTLEEKTSLLAASLDEKTSQLATEMGDTNSQLTSALEERATALSNEIQSSANTLRQEATKNTKEIATSTANAVQELTSKTELEINNVSTSFNTGLAIMRERSTEKFDQLDQQLSDLDTSVQTTNELAMRGQRDWVLAEVNYLLRTGVHRVKLAGDLKAGVMALESASDRLHTLGDIDYLPVREQIAEEVAALRRIGPPDIEGLIFKLQHMSKRADTLPLPPSGLEKTKQALAEDPAAVGATLGQSLLDKFKGSIKIVPSEGALQSAQRGKKIKPTKDQLTASDNLRLHLQAARLSALRHDAANFTEHMDNAIEYASEIYDQEDDQVQTYISDLHGIKDTNIVPKTPVLGSSLSLFTKIDSKRGTN